MKNLNFDVDIHMLYTSYFVNLSGIGDPDTKEYLRLKYDCCEEDDEIEVLGEDIQNWKLDIPSEAVDWNFPITDRKEAVLSSLLRTAPGYLVMAYGCRWDGSSGYTIAATREECFLRDYDTQIVLCKVSRGKKVLICRESSHDVPMGSSTIIVALSKKKLDYIGPYWKYGSGERIAHIARKYAEED